MVISSPSFIKAKAGVHPPAIDMHRAGTALTVIAALLGPGERDKPAVEQRGARST